MDYIECSSKRREALDALKPKILAAFATVSLTPIERALVLGELAAESVSEAFEREVSMITRAAPWVCCALEHRE